MKRTHLIAIISTALAIIFTVKKQGIGTEFLLVPIALGVDKLLWRSRANV